MRGDLRFGIHSGQQHTDFPGYVALWQAAQHLGFDWASVFELGVRDFLVLARPPADLRTLELVANGVAPALRAS